MHAFNAALRSVDVQSTMPKIDLRPAERAKLLGSQPVSIREQDRACIPCAIASSLSRRLNQANDFCFR
jgi:hypothetical protein